MTGKGEEEFMVAMVAKVGLKEVGSVLTGTAHTTSLLSFWKSELTALSFIGPVSILIVRNLYSQSMDTDVSLRVAYLDWAPT
jgi:hypothetical protein